MKRLFLILLVALAGPAAAQDYPAIPSTTVNDFADLIDAATEARIDAKLRRWPPKAASSSPW